MITNIVPDNQGGGGSTITIDINPTVGPYTYQKISPGIIVTSLDNGLSGTVLGLDPFVSYLMRVTDGNGCYTETNVVILRMGNNEQTLNDQLSIYPNPTNGNFTIAYHSESDLKAVIYNALGQKVDEYFLDRNQTEKEIPSENWSSGVYFCKFVSEGQLLGVQKVSIMK